MRIPLLVTALALLAASLPVAGAAPGDLVASGTILVGGPHTAAVAVTDLCVADGIDGFCFDAPVAGTTIATVTTDGSGTGYDLDIYFFLTDGSVDDTCATLASDEVCVVPDDVDYATVSAWFGAMLSVDVVLVE